MRPTETFDAARDFRNNFSYSEIELKRLSTYSKRRFRNKVCSSKNSDFMPLIEPNLKLKKVVEQGYVKISEQKHIAVINMINKSI